MWKTTLIAFRVTVVTLVLTGLLYPLVVTGLAQALFSDAANGSLVRDERGAVLGSALLAQGFRDPGYLQPRPSAAGESGFDATSSGGSNLGPTSKKLRQRVLAEIQRLEAQNPDAPRPVPVELVTASGSGLDPHLTPEGARWQVPRIARARRVALERVQAVFDENVSGRVLGFLGEPRVNVLLLNLALDRRFGPPGPAPARAK